MHGAISLFSRPESPLRAELGIESGAESTNEAHGSVASMWGNICKMGASLELRPLGTHDQFFVKLDMLAEERQNGTALTDNSTSLGTLSAHYSHELSQGIVSVLAWRTQEDFRSTYSAVSANRNAEVLTDRQRGRAGLRMRSEGELRSPKSGPARPAQASSLPHDGGRNVESRAPAKTPVIAGACGA